MVKMGYSSHFHHIILPESENAVNHQTVDSGNNSCVACGNTDLLLGIEGRTAVMTQQFGDPLDVEIPFLFAPPRSI